MEERLSERARIARELHDTLFQGFLGASMQLHFAVDQVPADSPSKPSLCRALRLMQRVIDEGRGALQGLRSTGSSYPSLEHALSGVREEFMPGATSFPDFRQGPDEKGIEAGGAGADLSDRAGSPGERTRHSEASSIEAEVEYLPRQLRVVVRDNGCGMDPQVVRSGRAAHWGLLGMRERAESIGAQLRIWSRPKAGTEVEISVSGYGMADACA